MKFFFKCFVLYFFCLVLLPCNEADAAVQMNDTMMNISAGKEKATHGHSDECPPLCSCTCCNHAVVKGFELSLNNRHIFISRIFSSHYDASVTDMQYPVWQPPQLD